VTGADELSWTARSLVRSLEKTERVPGLAAQCWAALNTLRDSALHADSTLNEIVKTTVYLADEADLQVYETIRREFLSDNSLPAFECVVISGPGPLRMSHVQIEAIGVTGT
jgi:enamine deaminase RidA (YjgF/YER057c/UK114 family)